MSRENIILMNKFPKEIKYLVLLASLGTLVLYLGFIEPIQDAGLLHLLALGAY